MSIENVIVARLESKRLCTRRRVLVGLRVQRELLELTADSHSDITYLDQQFAVLDQAMRRPIDTYLGGIPGKYCLLP